MCFHSALADSQCQTTFQSIGFYAWKLLERGKSVRINCIANLCSHICELIKCSPNTFTSFGKMVECIAAQQVAISPHKTIQSSTFHASDLLFPRLQAPATERARTFERHDDHPGVLPKCVDRFGLRAKSALANGIYFNAYNQRWNN